MNICESNPMFKMICLYTSKVSIPLEFNFDLNLNSWVVSMAGIWFHKTLVDCHSTPLYVANNCI